MYIILPFFYNGKWRFIAACRYIDELNELVKEMSQL